MVGDSVMYTWKGFFHGVVLSTSCEPGCHSVLSDAHPISAVSQCLAASWHDGLSPAQYCNILLQAFGAGTLPLCDMQGLHRMDRIGLETDVGK